MKTIMKYVRPQMLRIAFGLTVKLAGAIAELLLPWMLSVMLDEYAPLQDRNMIFSWGILMVLCAVFCLVANIAANRMSTRTSRDITLKLRSDLFAKTLSLSCPDADSFTVPSLISRITSDTYNVHNMIDRTQRLGVRAPILLIGGILVTFALDPVLTLVLILILPLLAVVIAVVTTNGIKLYTKAQTKLDALVRRAQGSMTGIRVIQALSKADREKEEFDKANSDAISTERKAGMLMGVTNPVMNLLLNVGLTAVVVVGAYRVNDGQMLPGTLIAFLSYFTIILNAMMSISRIFMICSKGVASGERIAEILDNPEPPLPIEETPLKTDDHIIFDKVSFSYDKKKDNVKDVSFTLKKGETLGIIGPTGSGKSTVIQLLMGYYSPDRGEIRINGRNIRAIPQDELHSMFGVALQNDFLYAGTVKDNIDFERGISDEAVKDAALTAQGNFISEREGGFEGTIAPKGQDLSGGQKQRLLIARALAGDPEILILDDSSSALDYKTDAAFRRALAKRKLKATKIIVAQRVSSIKNSDKILVIDDGNVIGFGNHDSLMKTCESYRQIATIQMGEVE